MTFYIRIFNILKLHKIKKDYDEIITIGDPIRAHYGSWALKKLIKAIKIVKKRIVPII